MALLSLKDVDLSMGSTILLEKANFHLEKGERVGLVGRNGAGKSTLLKMIAESLAPDRGQVVIDPKITVAYLTQEVPEDIHGTVGEVLLTGMEDLYPGLCQYEKLQGTLKENPSDAKIKQEVEKLEGELETEAWIFRDKLEKLAIKFQLDIYGRFGDLSAGWKRRVLFARALLMEPEVLLLDEPTNHLDIAMIQWLEAFLLQFKGSLLFTTHDRTFLQNLANRIVEIDRGNLKVWDCGYEEFLKRREQYLQAEAKRIEEFEKKLAQEEVWIRKGIQARRTRNEGRVRALIKMREEKRQMRSQVGKAKLRAQEADLSGVVVAKLDSIAFAYSEEKNIVNNFSLRVTRGDRIGIIGPNGCGKTTFVRILLGQLQPQSGTVKLGTNLEIAYFDQLRDEIDGQKSVADNASNGANQVSVGDKKRHVISYLQDFLFTPEQCQGPAWLLSGGERNRLLLAKLFLRPFNILVLDEPTNDLDMETLELLEEMLLEFQGTLILVSHDRTFINNVVTSSVIFRGDGVVEEVIGGYSDWQQQEQSKIKTSQEKAKSSGGGYVRQERKRKLTFKESRELQQLPKKIEELEAKIEQIHETMSSPSFYKDKSEQEIVETNQQLQELEKDLEDTYERWEELEEINNQ